MKKSLFVMAILIVLLVASMAFADTKIYPGSMCVPWNSNQPGPLLNAGAIQNPSSTAALRVDCPVIGNGLSTKSAWMRVRDRHYDEDVWAALVTVYASGHGYTWWSSPLTFSSGTNKAAQVLSFGFLKGASTAVHYFSCYIPPTYKGNMSSIISYEVNN